MVLEGIFGLRLICDNYSEDLYMGSQGFALTPKKVLLFYDDSNTDSLSLEVRSNTEKLSKLTPISDLEKALSANLNGIREVGTKRILNGINPISFESIPVLFINWCHEIETTEKLVLPLIIFNYVSSNPSSYYSYDSNSSKFDKSSIHSKPLIL